MKKLIFSILFLFIAFSSHAQDIFSAARTNNVAELKTFIANKTDVNQTNQRGFTALILAIYNNNSEAAKFLIDNSENMNAQDMS